jgi:hypothetical protein
LISVVISSYNCKLQLLNDIGTDNKYIPPKNLQTQSQKWPEEKKMKVNTTKSKFMAVNFTRSYQFNTMISIDSGAIGTSS